MPKPSIAKLKSLRKIFGGRWAPKGACLDMPRYEAVWQSGHAEILHAWDRAHALGLLEWSARLEGKQGAW